MGCVKVFLLILISKLTLAEYCLRTLETLEYVPTCPSNEEEWEAASKKMNCSKIKKTSNCENAIYHCLRDALSKTMVEVCTVPRKLTGRCPLFYRNPPYVRNDLARDCSKNNTCPPFYSSEDAYKYVACNNNTSLTTTESTSEPTSSFVTHTNTIRAESTPASNINSKGQNEGKQESDNKWMMIFFPVLVCLLILVAYILAVVWLKTRKHIPLKQALCIHKHIFKECQREDNDDQRPNTSNLQRTDIEGNGEENVHMPLLHPIDPEGNCENKGNSNPNLTGRTPDEDPQTPPTRNNAPDSMTQNNSHLPQSNIPISDDCVSDHAVKTDTLEKNIPGVSSNTSPLNTSAINQEEAISDMNLTSDLVSEHEAKASGNSNPNLTGRTPDEDPQTLESITTEQNNSTKNGTSEISSSGQDIITDTQHNISAEPENSTLLTRNNAPDSMTQNNSHLPQSNIPIPDDCVSDHAVKTDTLEKNIPGVSSNTSPLNTSAVNQEEAISDMNLTSDLVSEHDAKASGNSNPNLTGRTPDEDPQTLESITSEQNNSTKNGTSEISSSGQDITTDTQHNISAEPENSTLPTRNNAPDSMTQNNSHLPQSNIPIPDDCVSDHAVKTDTLEKNIPGVSSNTSPQNTSAVNQEEAISDMNLTSDLVSEHDAKASGGELPQREQKQTEINKVVESTALLCSEESSKQEIPKKDHLNTFLDLDVSADDLDSAANFPEKSSESVNTYLKKKKRKRRGTIPIELDDTQVNGDSEIPERNIPVLETLEQGLGKADRRIYELLKEQYGLLGRVRYLEIKLNCMNPLLSELEENFCSGPSRSDCENSKGDRFTYLETAYPSVLERIKKVESSVLPNESYAGTSASITAKTSNPDDGTDGHGACGSDRTSKVESLENMLHGIEERLNKIYQKGCGKQGQLKAHLAKMGGLECAVNQLENDHGLQVTSFTRDDEQTKKMVDKAPDRLHKIFRRLEEIDLHILK